jgi:hypothetical protein
VVGGVDAIGLRLAVDRDCAYWSSVNIVASQGHPVVGQLKR